MRPRIKFVVPVLMLALLVSLGVGTASYASNNYSSFSLSAHQLRSLIDIQQSQGLSAERASQLRSDLTAKENVKVGPFLRVQTDSQYGISAIAQVRNLDVQYWNEALYSERAKALVARQEMETAEGDKSVAFKAERDLQLSNALTPQMLSLLTKSWSLHAQILPLDNEIEVLRVTTSSNLDSAVAQDILTSPLPDLLTGIETYKKGGDATRLSSAQELIKSLKDGNAVISTRLGNAASAKDAMNAAQDKLDKAGNKNIDVADLTSSLSQVRLEYKTALDFSHVIAVANSVNKTAQERLDAYKPPVIINNFSPQCISTSSAQFIDVNLSTQQLTAYDHNCSFLASPITSGQVALPTDTGDFHIFKKRTPFQFISPWGTNSRFWYPPTWTNFAMEIVGDGTFLHDAPWQPNGTYGAGSQYGPYASHGCIHVPYGVMAQLYRWAPMGTEVSVHY